MLGKRARPMIGKISEFLIPNGHAELATSPKGPLDLRIQSPRGIRSYDLGGVGLGIVASLEKSGRRDGSGEIFGKLSVFGQSSRRSNPIPVNNMKLNDNNAKFRIGCEEVMESSEDYTWVTRYGGPEKSFTRVYCDRGVGVVGNGEIDSDRRRCKKVSIFSVSSPARSREGATDFPTKDILISCDLCHKKLHGKDIYIYRGEKGYCSEECRHRQIVMDERKQKVCRRVEADYYSGAGQSQGRSYSRDQNQNVFPPGILAI